MALTLAEAGLGMGGEEEGAGGSTGCRGRGLDKPVNRKGPRVVDNFQEINKHHPFEEGRGVRKGGQVFGLAEQVGVSLGKQVNPCNLIVGSTLDSGEDKAKEVLVVEEPVGTKNVEDIKDTWVVEKSNPTLRYQPYAARRRKTGGLGGGRACFADLLVN